MPKKTLMKSLSPIRKRSKVQMSPQTATSAETQFLQQLCQEKAVISVYQRNGIRLRGYLVSFDNHTLFLKGALAPLTMQIHKHAVATILPDSG